MADGAVIKLLRYPFGLPGSRCPSCSADLERVFVVEDAAENLRLIARIWVLILESLILAVLENRDFFYFFLMQVPH